MEYTPPKGFYDLRDFNIPNKTILKKLVRIQLALAAVNKQWMGYTKDQRKANSTYIEGWKEASSEMQQVLFSYGEKAQTSLEL
ncbi:hypothetical protein LCGC14_1345600 [marine sediment metagenome]|uniref:Uncharacterized protein n=1 Tax=marine sediment metagenome TaxID=412755 RepID=A0A0F9MTB2_9ZZZZ